MSLSETVSDVLGPTAVSAGELELADAAATPKGYCPGCTGPLNTDHVVEDADGDLRAVCGDCCPSRWCSAP